MVDPKKSFFTLSLIAVILGTAAPAVSATSRSQYFDFGPYYQKGGVLGFSFSSLENLPAPQIPDSIVPSKAEGILPGSFFYPFERLWENTQVLFSPDPVNREELWLKIASERLAEGKTLMEQGKTEAAATALSDYNKTMSSVAQNVSEASAVKVEEAVAVQAVLAQSLALSYPPAQAESWSRALEGASHALDKAAEVKGAPAIPEDLSSQIQQLKTDGLISEEESNKIYGFKGRSEVREELEKLASSGQFPIAELSKLDTAVAEKYPEVYKQQAANSQVAELRIYQSLPQPSEEALEGLKKYRKESSVSPSNDIKPYLWYNRAQELANKVDLSNFTPEQQTGVAKLYPQAVTANPTYSPPPSPSPSPSPSPTPAQTTTQPSTTDQTASPIPSPVASPSPAPTVPAAQLYVGAETGSLPGGLNYNIKRWNERLSLSFTFDPAEKARLVIQMAERRLAEATAILAKVTDIADEPKKASLYEGVLKDYQQAMDDAADLLKTAADSSSAKEVAKQLEVQAARHGTMLEKGLLPTPKDPKLISQAVQAAENVMDQAADTLDRPAVPLSLSQRLGDLKTQGLLLPEEAEDLVRSNSRTEVREKVRKLVEQETFPLADAKKLDEAQVSSSPSDYNQLVEVRKVEELQRLRAAQAQFAQTATLKSTTTTLEQKEAALLNSIEPALISEADLKGREDLVKTYKALKDQPRPINGGQFGPDVKPGVSPAPVASPRPADAVLSTCPAGAEFKQFVGCVWADTGKKLNDYDQYKCDGPRQYYSFAAKKCVSYKRGDGQKDDAQPICPVGYQWSWQNQSCQTSTGGILPFPTPSPEPRPMDVIDDEEREQRSKSCPEGSSYLPPSGCVWDDIGGSVSDPKQYRCTEGQYYSFEEHKCVPIPKPGVPYPKNTTPTCKAEGFYWSWSAGQCILVNATVSPVYDAKTLDVPKPAITPDSPIYFVKKWGDAVQLVVAVTVEAKEQARISQAKERLAESLYALQKGDDKLFDQSLAAYTAKMQELYNDLAKAKLSDKARKNISERLSQEATSQNLLLQKASVLADAKQDSAISAATSATILGIDKAADLAGEPAIPDEVKAKIEALPEKMISEEDKTALLEAGSRVEARLAIGRLAGNNVLTQEDTAFLNEDFESQDEGAKVKLEELQKLEEIATAQNQQEKLAEKVEKNEKIVQGLNEFQKTFEAGKEIPAEIRPYVRLTRIEEVAQTIRPDIVRLDEWQNRKDVILAVATLQEEFRPTRQSIQQLQDFRRRNPNANLPPDLARIEALSYNLGVRGAAGPCFLPTPPFPANTPCPAAGAAIPIASFIGPRPVDETGYRPGYDASSTDKDGKPLVYGQGPKAENAGVCPSGYHWMYDSGGWCMQNSGSYSSSYNYTPTGTGPGYTPYSPYYNAPGVPPATYGYPGAPGSPYSYSPPSYYGTAPTYYTTNPPVGTVPGSGPKPTTPGQCPSGYHWMSDSGGWCMSDGPTYVPGGGLGYPAGEYNCGSQAYDPVTKKCKDGACPGGSNWDGSKCVASPYSPNLTQSSCGPGYYWDGRGCIRTSPTDTYGSCSPPGGGCGGNNSYWDYGSCSCRTGSTTSSGSYSSGWNPASSSCIQQTCRSVEWFDWGTCSCRPNGNTYTPTYSGGSTYSGSSTTTSGGASSGGSSSSACPCPSGYHCMDNSWCMQDGSGSTGSSTGGSTTPSSTPAPSSAPSSTPPPSSAPSTESTPPPSSAPSTPPPSTVPSTESTPPPSTSP